MMKSLFRLEPLHKHASSVNKNYSYTIPNSV